MTTRVTNADIAAVLEKLTVAIVALSSAKVETVTESPKEIGTVSFTTPKGDKAPMDWVKYHIGTSVPYAVSKQVDMAVWVTKRNNKTPYIHGYTIAGKPLASANKNSQPVALISKEGKVTMLKVA